MKLTKAQRGALTWFAKNDGAKLIPIHISRIIRNRLVGMNLLRSQAPAAFGFSSYHITDAGRAALAEQKDRING